MEGALSWLETGTIAIATLEGWVASLTLSTMQMLTLYSGVLTLLSRAMGWPSHTMIGISTLNKMWTFNFVLVLLASCIAASLYDTLEHVLRSGWCELVGIIGRAVPRNTDFWLNYLVTETLLFIPLLDLLQVLPLLLLLVDAILRRIYRCCCAVGDGGGALARWARGEPYLPTLVQKLMFEYLYSRAAMVVSVGVMFSSIAPIVAVVVACWLRFASAAWAHNTRWVLRTPQGAGFDAGGVYWPHAVQKQVYALLVSQLVLAAVLALNLNLFPMLGVLALMTVTYVRAKSLAAYFGPLAADLPLSPPTCRCRRRGVDADGRDGVLLPRARGARRRAVARRLTVRALAEKLGHRLPWLHCETGSAASPPNPHPHPLPTGRRRRLALRRSHPSGVDSCAATKVMPRALRAVRGCSRAARRRASTARARAFSGKSLCVLEAPRLRRLEDEERRRALLRAARRRQGESAERGRSKAA